MSEESINEKFDPADFDLVATDKDKASAKMNIIMQLRKSMDVRGNLPIKFADGKSQKVPMNIAKIALDKYSQVRKPASKEKMQTAMSKSYKDMIMTLKTFKEETQMDEGFSPKEIKMAIGVASDKRYAGGNMTGAVKAIDKIKRGLSNHPQVSAVLRKQNESYGSMNASVDKVKIQKQIDQTEKYMKTFFGNTSSVKMKKFAMQKKIDKLKAQLKEEAILDKALNEAPRPPKISKGKAKGSISASGMRGKGNKKFDVTINFDNGKFSFRITDESGKFQTVGLKQASKMLGEEVTNQLMAEQNLQEAPNYKLHHNTFSGAVQEAIAVAKKQGYDVDEDDWSNKVATGPKKPSKDKTNRYSIKLLKGGKATRKFLQIQVYNMGSKYELNCYVQ